MQHHKVFPFMYELVNPYLIGGEVQYREVVFTEDFGIFKKDEYVETLEINISDGTITDWGHKDMEFTVHAKNNLNPGDGTPG